jgi:hypothetical protein
MKILFRMVGCGKQSLQEMNYSQITPLVQSLIYIQQCLCQFDERGQPGWMQSCNYLK